MPRFWAWREAAERREAKRGRREGFMGGLVGMGGRNRVLGVTMGGASAFRVLGLVFAYLVQPVLRMVPSVFAGRKEDSVTLRRGGTGLFPDSGVARRLRILIRALLAAWTRKKSLVHKTPSVRWTTLGHSICASNCARGEAR